MRKKPRLSRTDWDRVDTMKDEEIDASDIPLLDEAFFTKAEIRMPRQRRSMDEPQRGAGV
ncbi:MAG TPA: hypothetical protein VKK31_11540 [Thermoanaerobaculia bacterium]|nr:hypothetical protein [Thermoanaerobaculia bacterium]